MIIDLYRHLCRVNRQIISVQASEVDTIKLVVLVAPSVRIKGGESCDPSSNGALAAGSISCLCKNVTPKFFVLFPRRTRQSSVLQRPQGDVASSPSGLADPRNLPLRIDYLLVECIRFDFEAMELLHPLQQGLPGPREFPSRLMDGMPQAKITLYVKYPLKVLNITADATVTSISTVVCEVRQNPRLQGLVHEKLIHLLCQVPTQRSPIMCD